MSRGRSTVLYVVSRFPKLTETFVINEWLALSGRFDMKLAALHRTRQAIVQPQSAEMLDRVRFFPSLHPACVAAHLGWLARRPGVYLSTLAIVVRSAARASPLALAKSLVVFAKAVPLARWAARKDVAHVHAHFATHPATAAWIVHRLTGIPFSFTAHANDLFVRPPLLARQAATARFVAAISEYNRALLRKWCPATTRIELIRCGVDVARFAPSARVERDRDEILCVASLEPKKGHTVLLEALAHLAGRPRVTLSLVGDGPAREAIRRRARELGVSGRVRMHGPATADEVRAALDRAGVFALASVPLRSGRMEGIPVALMEAMASGLPVVASRLSGVPELVEDGVTGLLVAPADPRALADALTRILDDETLAARLGTVARGRVTECFDLTTEATRLGDLFAASISGRSSVNR